MNEIYKGLYSYLEVPRSIINEIGEFKESLDAVLIHKPNNRFYFAINSIMNGIFGNFVFVNGICVFHLQINGNQAIPAIVPEFIFENKGKFLLITANSGSHHKVEIHSIYNDCLLEYLDVAIKLMIAESSTNINSNVDAIILFDEYMKIMNS